MSILSGSESSYFSSVVSGEKRGSDDVFSDAYSDQVASAESFDINSDGIDDNAYHEGYKEDEVIGTASSASSSKDNLKHFSRDMRNDHYRIRDPKIQNEWGEKKTDMQRRASKTLLLTNYALWELFDECVRLSKQKGDPRIFSVLSEVDGQITLTYSKSLVLTVLKTLKLYLSGKSDLTRKQLIDLLVDDYNISFHHFVKDRANYIIEKCTKVKKQLVAWDACNYDVLQHPTMKRAIKRLEIAKTGGKERLVDTARKDMHLEFNKLNNELEQILNEKEEVTRILGESVARPDFIFRLLKALVGAFTQYRNRLIETNLRLVLSIAHKNKNKAKASNISVTDLISEGSEGLLKASEMYVSGIGVLFTTYAEPWVKQKITRHIKNTNDVRIPIHCTDLMFRVCKHFKDSGIEKGDNIPAKETVEKALKERVSDSVWEMAVNRFNGVSVSMSCDHSGAFEEGTPSFDHILGDKSEEDNGSLEKAVFANKILEIAKDVLSDNEYKVLTHYYLKDEKYLEIHDHLDRPYSSKSISMIKTRAILKVQAKIEEMGDLTIIRPAKGE